MLPLPEVLSLLSPATLAALAKVVGPVPGLRANATPAETARALFRHSATFRAPIHVVSDISEMFDLQAAAAVFSILPRFASEAAHDGIVHGARIWNDPRAETWARLSSTELAAAIAMEVATTMDVDNRRETYERTRCILNIARRRVDSEPTERPTYELLARTPPKLDPERLERALRRELGDALTDVWSAFDAADGSLLLALFVERGPIAVPTLTKSGRVSRRTFRPITVNLIRVHAGGGRVSLTLAEPRMLRTYAKALGLSRKPSFTLDVIHPSSIDAFQARIPEGMQVTFDLLGFRGADESEVEVEGVDAWNGAKNLWAMGTLHRARLRAKDEHGRPFHVLLELPHRVEIPELMTTLHARRLLRALGLLRADPATKMRRSQEVAPKTRPKARDRRPRTLH